MTPEQAERCKALVRKLQKEMNISNVVIQQWEEKLDEKVIDGQN